MKKTFKKALALTLALVMVFGSAPLAGLDLFGVNAKAASVSDLTFESINSGTAYEVSGCKSSASGELVIPSTYNGKPVTSIGEDAFWDCRSLTSITIPNSVTSIGYEAFSGCTSLTSITIPDSVTSIGEGAFYGCDLLTSITIPNSVTSIGEEAFYNCTSLTSITIPSGVTSIGSSAFYGCASLTSITIPSGVTSIGYYAFCDCKSLTSITIPNSVTSIGEGAFYNCTSLTSITIPDSVTSIGDYAFCDCKSLTSITIPNSVTSIGEEAFYNCESLTSFDVDSSNPNYLSQDGALFNKDKTKLIQYPAGNSRTSYEIPNSVTSIGDCAFFYCESLTSITIPNSVTSIDDYAFYWCTSLTSITIPNSVTSIDYFAFVGCTSLTSIAIPNSVTSIGGYAFGGCTALKDVYYSGTEEEWNNITIDSDNEPLNDATIHYNSAPPVSNTYTVTWDVDGVETIVEYEEGADIVKPANPTKQGYTFKGWGAEIPSTMPANDLTFTATWNVNTYKVTWIVDGAETAVNYEYGSNIVKPSDPTKQGYTFTGWGAEIPSTMPANDLTFTATWNVNTYKVTWLVDGAETAVNYEYGANIVKPSNPTKQGYTFKGWNAEIPSTMPAENLTFTAVFELIPVKTPTIKINNNPGTKTINYGEGIEFTATATDLPAGTLIKWYVNGAEKGTGTTFKFTDAKADATITVKVVDKNGNSLKDATGGEISESEKITVNAGFFQKLISFFKNLFKINRIIAQSIDSKKVLAK